jgi:hypothetical protein
MKGSSEVMRSCAARDCNLKVSDMGQHGLDSDRFTQPSRWLLMHVFHTSTSQ